MVRRRVYLETTVVSYLTARPSRSIVDAAHQAVTQDWWKNHRQAVELFISQAVLNEAARGNPQAAARRLALLEGLPQLAITEAVGDLSDFLVRQGGVPAKAVEDALHIALTTVHEMDVLLTWNCRHLANANVLVEIARLVRLRGYNLPVVCTPEAMLGG